MSSKRFFQILVGVIVLLAGVSIASVYYGQKMLAQKSTELDDLKVKTAALEQQERSLIQAKKEIEEYSLLETVAKSIVPQEKDQARTVREVVAIAEETGIIINNIAFPSSELGDEKTTTDPNKTQLEKVEGIPGLSKLVLTIAADQVSSDFPTIIEFLERLEQNRRTSAISSVIITPEGGSESLNLFKLTLTIEVYIKP